MGSSQWEFILTYLYLLYFINNWDFAGVLNLRSPFPIHYVIIGYTTFIGQKFDKAN